MSDRRWETRAVLAGAYIHLADHVALTHYVQVDVGGTPLRASCGRVKPWNFADAGATDPAAPPTCGRCVRAYLYRSRTKPDTE